jgi:hypothetical protein
MFRLNASHSGEKYQWWKAQRASLNELALLYRLPKVVLNDASIRWAWLTDHNIPKTNIIFLTENASTNTYQQTESNRWKSTFQIRGHNDCWLLSGSAGRKTCEHHIMPANTTQLVRVVVSTRLR